MMPNPLMRIVALLALLAGTLLLPGCTLDGGSEVIAYDGGSEVIAYLVTEDEQPVANAKVTLYGLSSASDTLFIDSVYSDEKGKFVVDSAPPAHYLITASFNDDSLVLPPYSLDVDSGVIRYNLDTLVMIVPGAIQGAVVLEPGAPDADIRCYIAGTSFDATTNSTTPAFTIIGIYPVDTLYELTVSASGYLRQVLPDIPVTAGKVTVLADTIRLVPDPGGAPKVAPEGLTVAYDTVSGNASAVWNTVNVDDVERYIVYRCTGSGCRADTVDDTSVVITIFTNTDDTVARTVLIQVSALDNDNNEGPRCPHDTIEAIPPAWMRISTSISRVADLGTVDTAYVTMSFTSRIKSVVEWTWWADDPDSVIDRRSGEELQSGSDTIVWLISSDKKRLYVSLTDDRGGVTVDSIDARSLLPIDVWVTVDSLLTARSYAGAAAVNGAVFVFGGGMLMQNGTYLSQKTTERYDVATGEWSRVASMQQKRFMAASAVADARIYVFGGSDGAKDLATVERYDPEADVWEIIDTMDQAVVGASAAVIDGIIYITGGLTGTSDSLKYLNSVTSYDPVSGEWGSAGTLAVGRQLHQTVAVENMLITIGGLEINPESELPSPLGSFECTSIGSAGVCPLSIAEIPGGRCRFGAAVVADKLVFFGGTDVIDRVSPLQTVEVFSTDGTGGNSGVDMPIALEGMVVVTLGGRIYCIGGDTRDTAGSYSSKAVYVYYP
ncbi:MAG: hypothetical protein JW863_08330 [Chitinispirillaceae bacterium]|nr:hypothetical protein [Chitinispirillaceae bacterium]